MPIQDTGLDVYESAMRPVRQNVQAIFAHQAKQKADAESERRQLELEQRAERRQMELESRAEGRVIRTEARRKAEEDSDTMAAAVAEAERYGLPTENRTSEQLQQDVKKEVAKKVPRDFLMANMDKLPGILDQETISAIQNNALSEGELAQIKANVEGSIQTSRASDAEMFRRQSPVYLEDRKNAEGMLVNIAEQRAAVYGAPLGDAARRAIAAAFPQDDSTPPNVKWLEYRKKAAMRTIEDPDIQDMLSTSGSYNRLRANFAQNPGLVILGHSPINSNGDKLDSMDDEDKMLLMEAWARGQAAQSSHANQKEEADYWRAERSLKAAHEAQNPMSRELAELKKEEFAIYKRFPELHGWNSQHKRVMPKVNAATADSGSDATTDSDGDSSGFGNAMQRLQGASNNSTTAAEPAPVPVTEPADTPADTTPPVSTTPTAVPPPATLTAPNAAAINGFAGNSPTPHFPFGDDFLKKAGSTGRVGDAYVRRAALVKELDRARSIVAFREARGERPFQIDLETVAGIEAQLRALMAENPELRQGPAHTPTPAAPAPAPAPAAPDVTAPDVTPDVGSNMYEQAVQAQMGQAPPSLGNVTDPYVGYREMLLAPKPPTPFKQYLDDVLDPNRQGPFDRYLDTKAFNQANPPIGNEPWMQEYRNRQLPPAPQRTLPTQPTWQTY